MGTTTPRRPPPSKPGARRRRIRRRLRTAAAVAFVAGLASGVATSALAGGSTAATTGGDAIANVTGSPAFTQTKQVTRTETAATGAVSVVASNSVTLDVSQTNDLQGRQEIAVSWSGAHPTGGVVTNQNAVNAQYEEYPVVLLQCRDTATQADQPTPETCWTQAATERFQSSYTTYPPYQLDQYQTTAGADWYGATPGAAVVNQPSSLPTTTTCKFAVTPALAAPVRYWVPWLATSGQVYAGGPQGSCGQPPEASGGLTSALPSNETFGVTASTGSGSAEFDLFTQSVNATLGCSDTVQCSLVAIPIEGISCNGDGTVTGLASGPAATAALQDCEANGAYAPGASARTGTYENGAELTVTGSLWWSPSNWRNRIVVPLTFDPPRNVCTLVSGNHPVDVYGSELLTQATSQWAPSFCQDASSSFSFDHVAVGEPQARNLVANGTADAAFTSYAQPGGYGKPVVNAPVAVSGFTIAYAISSADGQEVTDLRLTPLLLAKLLTQSYPDLSQTQGGDAALAHNPVNITQDPEFIALNPIIPQRAGGFAAGAELLSISSNSDVLEALTTYIDGTPAAHAWLDGTPDNQLPGIGPTDAGWSGMTVNPAYKGLQLPVNQWPLLSTYESSVYDHGAQRTYCLATAPQPLSSLVSAPVANLAAVSLDMQFQNANSTVTCTPDSPTSPSNSMVATGRQSAGNYFMLGVAPLADDERYNLQAASLQTTAGTFVAPSDPTLEAATSLLKPDTTTGTWPIPYQTLQTAAGAGAYPGTMVVYAAVPTSGLTATDAADLADLLRFAASTGQTSGAGVGQLPPGYLPLTAADGLDHLAAYTQAAAADVAAQNGKVPSLVATTTTRTTTTASAAPSPSSSAGSSTSSSGGTASGSSGNGGSGSGSGSSSRRASASSLPARSKLSPGGAASGGNEAAKATQQTAGKAKGDAPTPLWLGKTLDVALWTGDLGTGGAVVALILGLALLIVVLVPPLYLAGRKRGKW